MGKCSYILALTLIAAPAQASDAYCSLPHDNSGAMKSILSRVTSVLASTNLPRHSGRDERVGNLPPLFEDDGNSRKLGPKIRLEAADDNGMQVVIEGNQQGGDIAGQVIVAEELLEQMIEKKIKDSGGYGASQGMVSKLQLSPKTLGLLRGLPAGISDPQIPKTQKIAINRGLFEESYIDAAESVDGEDSEAIDAGESKASFEIQVKNQKVTAAEIDQLQDSLKALSMGQYESAVAMYKAVLAKDKKNKDALLGLATAYHKSGQRTQARAAYENLLRYYPKYEAGLNNLLALAAEEAPLEALAELDELQRRSPNLAVIYAQKAYIYADLSDYEKAIENFARALEVEPDNADYQYNLAIILDQNGHREDAARIYQNLIALGLKGKRIPVDLRALQERLAYVSANLN
ncbi:MAG: hypothetical protein COV36_07460 [Alphaproteobacteria bacterium CG11_big_fil_rev_8_21_14_0_20_44_7]|nr:MAG: hypothetical protein COV36_07460 [Alphaproteobacteria bacterium CG11_big_fil_rev_8_21_14_0_20_44_7]